MLFFGVNFAKSNMMIMEEIYKDISNNGGFITTSDMTSRSEYRRVLRAVKRGELTKVRHGVYATPDELLDNMIDVERIVPGGIVCLYNAWTYYNLTTTVPPEFCIAISAKRKVSLNTPFPIKLLYWKKENLDFGITEAVISNHRVKITDLERSVCDAVKYRNKVGMDICSEVIRNYIHREDRNLSRLSDYAKKLRVEKTINNYFEIILGE